MVGREILRGAARHFELPGNYARRQDWPRDHEIGKCRLEFGRRPTDQSPGELMAGEQPPVMRFHPHFATTAKIPKISGISGLHTVANRVCERLTLSFS